MRRTFLNLKWQAFLQRKWSTNWFTIAYGSSFEQQQQKFAFKEAENKFLKSRSISHIYCCVNIFWTSISGAGKYVSRKTRLEGSYYPASSKSFRHNLQHKQSIGKGKDKDFSHKVRTCRRSFCGVVNYFVSIQKFSVLTRLEKHLYFLYTCYKMKRAIIKRSAGIKVDTIFPHTCLSLSNFETLDVILLHSTKIKIFFHNFLFWT